MKKNIELSIAHDFSNTPGGRYEKDGKFSGEKFRKDILKNKYLAAKAAGVKLIINLDGCMGYPSSFLDESFGGLAQEYINDNILDVICFVSDDQPNLIDKIKTYISNNIGSK